MTYVKLLPWQTYISTHVLDGCNQSHTTMRFTRTRLSVIVHPAGSLQLTKDLDRVRSIRDYNVLRGASSLDISPVLAPAAETLLT
jgi:hypothetical protein